MSRIHRVMVNVPDTVTIAERAGRANSAIQKKERFDTGCHNQVNESVGAQIATALNATLEVNKINELASDGLNRAWLSMNTVFCYYLITALDPNTL